MSWDHILDQRLADWDSACEAWGFDFDPRVTAGTLAASDEGLLLLRARRLAHVDGQDVSVTLDVREVWSVSPHEEDGRLDRHDGSVTALRWHVQVGPDDENGDHAERLEVVVPDETHPRIHRHPYGWGNDQRVEDEFLHPDGFLFRLNTDLGGAFDD